MALSDCFIVTFAPSPTSWGEHEVRPYAMVAWECRGVSGYARVGAQRISMWVVHDTPALSPVVGGSRTAPTEPPICDDDADRVGAVRDTPALSPVVGGSRTAPTEPPICDDDADRVGAVRDTPALAMTHIHVGGSRYAPRCRPTAPPVCDDDGSCRGGSGYARVGAQRISMWVVHEPPLPNRLDALIPLIQW